MVALNVIGFYNGLNEQARGYTYLRRYGSLLDYLAVFQIGIRENGSLSGALSQNLVRDAHAMGIKVLLVFSNLNIQGQFSTPLMTRMIREPQFADLVWQNIRDYVVSHQCDGVNLDLERARPEDRTLFSRFVNNWGERFQRQNFFVSMDVPAKFKDEPAKAWTGPFDYHSISQNLDAIVLMTYEEHWPGSSPGSVASLGWVTRVLDYALANMPANKIYMGLPLYGYDWTEGGGAQVISRRRALEVAQRFGATSRWDDDQHSTYFTYENRGRRHTVYFEDPRSTREKLDLARRKGIRGVAIWEMNLSYPEFWEVLREYV